MRTFLDDIRGSILDTIPSHNGLPIISTIYFKFCNSKLIQVVLDLRSDRDKIDRIKEQPFDLKLFENMTISCILYWKEGKLVKRYGCK